jgi:tetratricopeptide (TPR) repeat protein
LDAAAMGEPARVTAEAGLDALARMLAMVPTSRLTAVAEELFPFLPLPAGFSWDDRRAVVARVATLDQSGIGVPPLVAYATRLAHELDHLESLELSRWADAAGRAAGMSEAALRQLFASSQPASQDGDSASTARPGRYDPDRSSISGTPTTSEDASLADRSTLVDQPGATPGRSNAVRIWGGVPFRNPDFTGRDGLLLTLQRALASRAKASVLPHTLQGFGGVGKTQLAAEYAYRFADRYDLVWWIPAEQQSLVLQSLAELGRMLDVPIKGDVTQVASLVIEALSSTTDLRWLLIYDNATQPDDLTHLIPSYGGHVIITSRDQTWANVWEAIEVNVFARPESIALIRKRNTGISAEEADRLAGKLGDLPLALDQATTWQSETGMPVAEYIELFDRHHRSLVGLDKPANYPITIAVQVRLALQRLEHSSPAVAQLLQMFAFFGAEPISSGLLSRGQNRDIADPLGEALGDPVRRARIVRELRKSGLAKVDGESRIQVHRLIQLVLREELSAEQLQESRTNVHLLLGAANPGEPDKDSSHPTHAEIAPHVVPAGLIDAEFKQARHVVLDQIRYLWDIGDFEGSRKLGDGAVSAWSKRTDQPDVGPEGELTLLASRHLGNALFSLGFNDRARALWETTLERLRENPKFGPDHEHTLYTASGVAAAQRLAGEYQDALDLDTDNVERCQRVFGAEDPETLRHLGNLAVNYRMLGDYESAYQIDEEIVSVWEENVSEHNRHLLFAQANLARDLYGLGRYTQALSLQARLLPAHRQMMPDPKHPDVLLATRTLAIALRKTGRYTDAVRLARENYRDCTVRYKPDHERSLAATMTYANSLRVTGELSEARGLALEAVTRYRRAFGEKHPLTLAASVNAAIIVRGMDSLSEAHRIDETAHAHLAAKLGLEHEYTLCAANSLANDLALTGEVADAQRMSAETLERSRRSRGEKHPYTLLCAVNAAFDLVEVGKNEAGGAELAAAIGALTDVLGADHPETLDARRGKRAECDIEPPPT